MHVAMNASKARKVGSGLLGSLPPEIANGEKKQARASGRILALLPAIPLMRCFVIAIALTALAACDNNPGPNTRSLQPNTFDPNATLLSGDVRSYFDGKPVSGAFVQLVGATQVTVATTDKNGAFQMRGVPAGSRVQLKVHVPNGYLDTLNPLVVANGQAVHLGVVDINILQTQYRSLNVTMQTNASVALIELIQSNGTPRDLVPASNISLQPAPPNPAGPYFLDQSGLDRSAQKTVNVNGRAALAFVNLSAQNYTLTVQYPSDLGVAQTTTSLTKTATFTTTPNLAVIVRVNDPAAPQ
jgi:hypothetical protein